MRYPGRRGAIAYDAECPPTKVKFGDSVPRFLDHQIPARELVLVCK